MFTRNCEVISEVKGLGILLVVFAHAIPDDSYVRNFIYLFHLPLFYFASGFFYKEKYDNQFFLFVKRRIDGLYVPFVLIGSLFLIFHNVFVYLGFYDLNMYFSLYDHLSKIPKMIAFSYYEPLLGIFWFLKSLFIVACTYCLIRKIFRKKNLLFMVIFLTIVGLFASRNIFPLHETVSELALLPFFFMGHWVSQKVGGKEFSLNCVMLFVAVLLLVFNVGNHVEINAKRFGYNEILFYFLGMCGIYVSIAMVRLLNKVKFIRLGLGYLGRSTMPIFIWHFFWFRIVSCVLVFLLPSLSWMQVCSHPCIKGLPLWYSFVYFVFGILGPLFFSMISKKLKQS